ncbi:unnamed protein product [Clonostachys rhizophaga]|uniref:Uncharacterized protein n=1 Tax=Clonostachys rhizophaga TaxID=160324 RepID=A0A9N9YM04_9HYPO|nr:unnamed protein product [Clonostachys rhizophaga]
MASKDHDSIKKVPSVDGMTVNFETCELGSKQVQVDRSRLVRKIDLRLMPAMICSYMLQYLDKTTLGYAAVTGIRQDTVSENANFESHVCSPEKENNLMV